jgi:hypothetical protein
MMHATSSPPSRNIPINRDSQSSRRLARAEEAMQQEAAMADYVDFCFASRLIHGMQKRQSYTHDVSLRYENQALIDHIIATRQNRADDTSSRVFPTTGSRRNSLRALLAPRTSRDSNDKLVASQDDSLHEEWDDMIFDMEL